MLPDAVAPPAKPPPSTSTRPSFPLYVPPADKRGSLLPHIDQLQADGCFIPGQVLHNGGSISRAMPRTARQAVRREKARRDASGNSSSKSSQNPAQAGHEGAAAFLVAAELMIALPYRAAVFVGGVPDL